MEEERLLNLAEEVAPEKIVHSKRAPAKKKGGAQKKGGGKKVVKPIVAKRPATSLGGGGGGSGGGDAPDFKTLVKRAYSKAYHQTRAEELGKGIAEEQAKKAAQNAGQAARDALLASRWEEALFNLYVS